jgi:ATP-dependent phosphofructokinase / diphosphate-dependent phosphofructokinase
MRSPASKILYAQSGGVTAVINASAVGVVEAARRHDWPVLAARNGILGVLAEDLVDLSGLDKPALEALGRTPGGAFGACRFDLDPPAANPEQARRMVAVLRAHGVGVFLYNGGNGSMQTVLDVAEAARREGYPLRCLGIPKTVDNDLDGTDCCPGFGSAARFLATAMREAGLDVASMFDTRGRIFVMEVMGRNAGWLAAATGLAQRHPADPPHLILVPELPLDEAAFFTQVQAWVARLGYCTITVAEGLRGTDGRLLAEQEHDRLGHVQLGGAGFIIAHRLHRRFGYKTHVAVPDYLQRSPGHWVSGTDWEQARAVGAAAVDLAVAGADQVMTTIVRESDEPYRWRVGSVGLATVANLERRLPADFLGPDGYSLSPAGRRYLAPLIQGERPVPCREGLPDYPTLTFPSMRRMLASYDVEPAA